MPVLAHEAIQPWLNKTLANWHFGTGDLNQAEYALLFGVANASKSSHHPPAWKKPLG